MNKNSRTCKHCGSKFLLARVEGVVVERNYCGGTCERRALAIKPERSRQMTIKVLKTAEADVLAARERLADLARKAILLGHLSNDAVLDVNAEIRFDSAAIQNRDNVVANRVKMFCLANEQALMDLLQRYCYNAALDSHSMSLMWNKIVGHPQPIIVEPEPSLTEYIDDPEELDPEEIEKKAA